MEVMANRFDGTQVEDKNNVIENISMDGSTKLLKSTSLASIQDDDPDKKEGPGILWVRSTDSVAQVLQVCSNANISSCPVWDDHICKCVGLIDMADLVALIVQIADDTRPNYSLSIVNGNAIQESRILDIQRKEWNNQAVAPVINLCGTNEVYALNYGSSVYDALVLLSSGLHRLPLLSADNSKIISMISQSLILEWLANNLHQFGKLPSTLIQQVLNTSKVGVHYRVVSVSENDLVIDAFRKIRDEKVTGVAVIANEYKLKGVISVTDLKWIFPNAELNELLYVRAGEFVEEIQKHNAHLKSPIVAVTLIDTIATAVQKIVENKVHRIFVVRSLGNDRQAITSKQLLGVLSLRDILALFLNSQK